VPVPPVVDTSSRAYWDGARAHRLVLAGCTDCGFLVHYPRARCPRCLSTSVEAREVSGRGRVASWTVTHRPPAPAFADDLPIVLVLVELDAQPGLRIAATMAEGEARPAIGDSVDVVFDDRDGYTLPRFRLTPSRDASPR
jgi:uncharacterized OB-fold protein